jgi:hypothetical protein
MASTYTTNLRLTKQADGENPNSWGAILNDGVISLVDDAIAGYTTVSLGSAATVTLTNVQGAGDQARSAILEFKGTVGGTHDDIVVLVPNNSKSYIVRNSVSYNDTTDSVVMRVAGHTGVTVNSAETALYVTNGTTVYPVKSNTFTNLVATTITAGTVNTSTLNVSTSALFVDNAKLNIGTGSDLQIYHDASNSYIQEAGTGSLIVGSNIFAVKNAAVNETILTGTEDGAVELYFDNAKKLVTTTVGVSITGNMVATTLFGDGSNLTGLTTGLPINYLGGLTLSNNSSDAAHDIDIAAGAARDNANGADLTLSSAMTKQIDATWASGDGNGGMADGVSLSTNTWYHVFVVETDAGGVDAGFDTAVNASNLVGTSGVASAFRRIGSVLTDGSSDIISFIQFGDEFIWSTQVTNVNGSALGTSRVLQTVTSPLGVQCRAILGLLGRVLNANNSVNITLTNPDVGDTTPALANLNNAGENSSNLNGTWASGTHIVLTNTSSQVAFRQSFDSTVYINTNGYYDSRGK